MAEPEEMNDDLKLIYIGLLKDGNDVKEVNRNDDGSYVVVLSRPSGWIYDPTGSVVTYVAHLTPRDYDYE